MYDRIISQGGGIRQMWITLLPCLLILKTFMELNQNNQPANIRPAAEEFGQVRNSSESFRTVPHGSETFGKVPNDSAQFGSVPHASERKENHTLTVREAARMFETAEVARTERSIVNWCQPNRTGIARLDSYFDPNERKYFLTPQSVERAIREEKAKAARINDSSEQDESVRQPSETAKRLKQPVGDDDSRIQELERENLDLKITNRAKDIEIERTHKERDRFFEQLLTANRNLGALETKLLQIAPSPRSQIEDMQDEDAKPA
jgi:hypothetical protein